MYEPHIIQVNTWDIKSQISAFLRMSYPSMINMLITAAGIPQISLLSSNHYPQPSEKRQRESQSVITGRHLKVSECTSPPPPATSLETEGHQPALCWDPSHTQLTAGAAPPANFPLRYESKPTLMKLPRREEQITCLTSSCQRKAFRCAFSHSPQAKTC